ncbi:uncharacterized protein LOC125680113 [Ostrea edulis]|uniref:uncharacterized protein LOC125680113 n=1 Tax=Ostrea edulis TaxID=37623 RepID=UPI0024AEE267|nr:uncharacterized protein LOC125680113 [Ostrea edulis]
MADDGQCNETLTLTADIVPNYVTSPGYDNDRLYSGDLTCWWQIEAAPDTSLVFSLTISQIPCSLGDYVKLFLNNKTDVLNDNEICGRGRSFGPMSFENSSALVIEFVSKSSRRMVSSKKGFRLQYLSATEQTAGGCQQKQVLMADDTPRYISSPRFPDFYPPNATCEWEIKAPTGYDINILILFIDIESGNLCSFDYLGFNQGSTSKTNLLCSENSFSFGNVQGNNFIVSFSSDGSENGHGFLLRYKSTEATPKNCTQSKADVVFLLDSSGSVGETNFAFLTAFISDLISDFNIGQEFIQVGLVTYETNVTNQFDLNQFATKEELINATNHVSYKGGWTYTDRGLNYTLRHSFTEEHGARPDTTRVLLVFTDGVSNYPYSTRAVAEEVKNTDTTIISVGIESGVDSPELFAIASQEEFVFRATSFTDLETIKYSLENIICKIISSKNSITTSAFPPLISPSLLISNTSLSSTVEAANTQSTTELLFSSSTTENDSTASNTSSTTPLSTTGTGSILTGSTDRITSPFDIASFSTQSDESSTTSFSTTQKSTEETFSQGLSTTHKSTKQTSSQGLSTTQKWTQQTSSEGLSTIGTTTGILEVFLQSRDMVAIITVCTVFFFLSVTSCCILLGLCIRRRRRNKKNPPKPTKDHEQFLRDLDMDYSIPIPVVQARADNVHVHYHVRMPWSGPLFTIDGSRTWQPL